MNSLIESQTILFSKALSLTKNKQDAKDLLQDTNLRILKNKDKYIERKKFINWAITIMFNIFKDNLRKKVNLQEINEDQLNIKEDKPDKMDLKAYIKNIKSKEIKRAVYMRYLGFKGRELSDILEIPHSTIRKYFAVGNKILRKTINL